MRSVRIPGLAGLVMGLVFALLATSTVEAQSAAPTAGASFEQLQREFAVLHRSLRNMRGILEEDRPVLEAQLARVETFLGSNPDHAGGVAIALQLSLWLGDEARIAALYRRLKDVTPDNPAIALAWLEHLEAQPNADADSILEGFAEVAERFPDSSEGLEGWTRRLKERGRYAEVVDILETRDLESMPSLAYTLADCLFAEHQFAEALSTLEAIPEPTDNPGLRADLRRAKPDFEQYVEWWSAEQTLRAADAEAGMPRVRIVTSRGTIVVELFENEAPNTVANFISLAKSGFYTQTKFHRFEPDFMIQGGDPNTKPGATGTPGLGDPGYRIRDEHEADGARRHFHDSIAMAKSGAPNSGGCQFYFNFRPTPWLNGRHTVFGRVVEGLDVVRSLRKDDDIIEMELIRPLDREFVPETIALDGEG